MEVPDTLISGREVLVIWHAGNAAETMQPLVEELRKRAGEKGRVSVENVERLAVGEDSLLSEREKSVYVRQRERESADVSSGRYY